MMSFAVRLICQVEEELVLEEELEGPLRTKQDAQENSSLLLHVSPHLLPLPQHQLRVPQQLVGELHTEVAQGNHAQGLQVAVVMYLQMNCPRCP